MKINEIPEKIYLDYEPDEDKIHIFINYMWHRHPFDGKNLKNVEYTRTDAFIEKAFNFLIERYENQGVILLDDIYELKSIMEEQK